MPAAEGDLAFAGQQQRMAERGVVADAIVECRQPGGVGDSLRVDEAVAGADGGVAHLPPWTSTRSEPRSGRLGSLSTRTISSRPIRTRSGMATRKGICPRRR